MNKKKPSVPDRTKQSETAYGKVVIRLFGGIIFTKVEVNCTGISIKLLLIFNRLTVCWL